MKALHARPPRRPRRLRGLTIVMSLCSAGVLVIAGAEIATASNDQATPVSSKDQLLARQMSAVAHQPQRPKPAIIGNAINDLPQADSLAPAPPAGILEDMHYGPFSASDFQVSNVYRGPFNGSWYVVYAGKDSTGLAGVRVLSGPGYDSLSDLRSFPLVGTYGALSIHSYSDGKVLLDETSGGTITFDLNTFSFA